MARNPIGPTFDYDTTNSDTHGAIYGVYANGKAPLNFGGAPGVHLGVSVGRVWQQAPYGWVAAPRALPGDGPDSWSAEVDRSVRHFRTRREASVFLWGHRMGHGRATPDPRLAVIRSDTGATIGATTA